MRARELFFNPMSYIEIYHIAPQTIKKSLERNDEVGRVARAISELDPLSVHYETRVNAPLAYVPKTTRIILGGAYEEMCIITRKENYELGGFGNVEIDPSLTVSLKRLLEQSGTK